MTANEHATRDPYVDWLRAVSLLVVVLWHWAFTILRWSPEGPHATNPLGFFSGLWIFTWLLQVLPVFFYVGGYVHLVSWDRARARGDHLGHYMWRHTHQLLVPAALLMVTWAVLGVVLGSLFNLQWIRRAVVLVISPLWFLAVYVALLPLSLWLHRRFDVVALIWLGGIAMFIDVLRFRYGVQWVGWINMGVVWGLAYQAGFFYQRIVIAPRRLDLALLWAGLFGLMGLVVSGLYPGSMVGVPGDRLSNMAPPTFVIVALLVFQIGVAEVVRPAMEKRLQRARWRQINTLINRFALPLFLFHTTAMALARAADYFLLEGRSGRPHPRFDLVAGAPPRGARPAAVHAAGDRSFRSPPSLWSQRHLDHLLVERDGYTRRRRPLRPWSALPSRSALAGLTCATGSLRHDRG